MADFIVRKIQNICEEMNYQQAKLYYFRTELDEIVKQMSRDEMFENSICQLSQIKSETLEEQSQMFLMARALFRIENRYRRCEERIIDFAEDTKRIVVLRSIMPIRLNLPPGFKVDVKLY